MPRLRSDDALLGTTRAAAYLGVHRSTLKSWRVRGVVRASAADTPRGVVYLFDTADLDRLRTKIDYRR
jgi:hypothetical protein